MAIIWGIHVALPLTITKGGCRLYCHRRCISDGAPRPPVLPVLSSPHVRHRTHSDTLSRTLRHPWLGRCSRSNPWARVKQGRGTARLGHTKQPGIPGCPGHAPERPGLHPGSPGLSSGCPGLAAGSPGLPPGCPGLAPGRTAIGVSCACARTRATEGCQAVDRVGPTHRFGHSARRVLEG